MIWILIIVAIVVFLALWEVRHQRSLKLRAHLMQEAIRNRDFTFRLPTDGMLPGERAMQQTLNQLGETIRHQMHQNEVESWERLTRVLTHEMMNATAPITSISQSLLTRPEVKGSQLEDGIQAIYETSKHLSDFVTSYRKMSQLEKPSLCDFSLLPMLNDLSRTYPQLTWEIHVPEMKVHADAGMLRQVLMNLVKNATEAGAHKVVIESTVNGKEMTRQTNHPDLYLYVGNDGAPIPAEVCPSIFVPFFTTKRNGSGIGLSLSRRMMLQQGGFLELADLPHPGCHAGFVVTIPISVE